MRSNKTVGTLGRSREKLKAFVPLQKPLSTRITGKGAKGGFHSGIDAPVRGNEMNRPLQLIAPDLRKPNRNRCVLKWQIINLAASELPPALNPDCAKVAIAIEYQKRLLRSA